MSTRRAPSAAPQSDLASPLEDGDEHDIGDAYPPNGKGDGSESQKQALERRRCFGSGGEGVRRIRDRDVLGRRPGSTVGASTDSTAPTLVGFVRT